MGKGLERKLIIWKLCNHPNYDSLLKQKLEGYANYVKVNPNQNASARKFKHLQQIAKRLEKTSPLYDWDEKYLEPKPFKGVMPVIVY